MSQSIRHITNFRFIIFIKISRTVKQILAQYLIQVIVTSFYKPSSSVPLKATLVQWAHVMTPLMVDTVLRIKLSSG